MGSARARLCVMMFLEYFVWGSWGVAIGGYMGQTLKFSGAEIGMVYSTTAIAAIISPFLMGYIADRLLATERLLALLHLAGAALLYYASTVSAYMPLWWTMMAYALIFMPTLALTNSISFENIKDTEKEFPLIRVFGTIGWIAANLVVNQLGWGETHHILELAAGSSVALGLFSLLLPHTPPKPRETHAAGRGGLLHLFREPSFVVFLVASFLLCIPLAFYYSLCNVFLLQLGHTNATALQTLGQFSEIFFMAAMPFFVARLGIKRMLLVGMAAWVLRYVFFGSLSFPLILIGLLLHGVCYDFYFVACYIYVDKKAEVSQRARAQSFFALITLGLGMLVGNTVAGRTMDYFHPPRVQVTAADGKSAEQPLPDWDAAGKQGLAAEFALKADGKLAKYQLNRALVDPVSKATYSPESLQQGVEISDAAGNKDGAAERAEWQAAQRNDWPKIWFLAAGLAAFTLVFFWLGFHDRAAERGAEGPVAH